MRMPALANQKTRTWGSLFRALKEPSVAPLTGRPVS
jgi:hypothetical protein